MLNIDGSRYSGSGTIVRQAVAFSALTGLPIHVVQARAKREKPGLRPQHLRVVEAIAELVNAGTEGLAQGSQEFVFRPGTLKTGRHYHWAIGSAGSTTMLALGILPVLTFSRSPVTVELRGGLFQDFAPSVFHLQHVLLPMLRKMGLHASLDIERPGYVPKGEGILNLTVKPLTGTLQAIVQEEVGPVTKFWGIALSSHLEERHVSRRMADAAQNVLVQAGYWGDIELRHDTESVQRGAALALFADEGESVRLGADQAGALRRSAESIGKHVAKQLLDDLTTGATLDRFAADQVIPFAALATGESQFLIPTITDHVLTSAWLAREFLDADVEIDGQRLTINGAGFRPNRDRTVGYSAPSSSDMGPSVTHPPTRFIADAMLGRLARWLRMLGYDTAYEKVITDESLIERAIQEDRWLLTRDRRLTERKVIRDRYTLIASDDLEDQLRQLNQNLKMDLDVDHRRGYRCADCNIVLVSIPRDEATPLVPPFVAGQYQEFLQCAQCRRVFWQGTHWEDFHDRIAGIRNRGADEADAR